MISIRKPMSVVFGMAVCFCAALPATVSAQAATEPPLPRNNVSGSAIANRRPGAWVQSGIAVTSHRISVAITDYGGVDYTEDGPPPSFRDKVLPQLVQILLGVMDQLSLLIQTLIQPGTLPAIAT